MIRASAPGKLMLAGEYIVVERGLPALAVTVDRRLTVDVQADPSRRGWVVTSAGLGLTEASVDKVPVLAQVLTRLPGLPQGGLITVRSELGEGADKPGLGGSAALCAAAFAGLWRLAGAAGAPDLDGAIAAHRAAQGGRGSGYDVATSMQGGLALFHPGKGKAAVVEPIAWPKGLYAGVFRSLRGASTPDLLARVEAWRDEDPESLEACLDPLAIETESFIAAFRDGEVGAILDAAAQLQEELVALDRIGEIGIFGGGQLQLLGAIEDLGAIGRTSGAGGGDCAWALTDDPELLARMTPALAELGFSRLDVSLGAPGVQVGEAE